MARFRWTRAKYYKAAHLSRLLSRFNYYYTDKPPLVERYLELCEHIERQGRDPLLTPIGWRYDTEIPF